MLATRPGSVRTTRASFCGSTSVRVSSAPREEGVIREFAQVLDAEGGEDPARRRANDVRVLPQEIERGNRVEWLLEGDGKWENRFHQRY
jgi:hypothetical protein